MSKYELVDLHFYMGMQIRNDFGLWTGNKKLMESCQKISDIKSFLYFIY